MWIFLSPFLFYLTSQSILFYVLTFIAVFLILLVYVAIAVIFLITIAIKSVNYNWCAFHWKKDISKMDFFKYTLNNQDFFYDEVH